MTRIHPRATLALLGLLMLWGATALAADAPDAAKPMAAAEFRLADHAGKVVVVDFWASWCKPCGKSLPWLSELAKAHQAEGLVVVAVNLDETFNAKARDMVAGLDPCVVVVSDPSGSLAEQCKLEGMPSAFVYDRAGQLRFRHTGFLASESAAREAEILVLLKEAAADAHH